jgi:hypothetical protein
VSTDVRARWLVFGLIAGALSFLVFHQGAIALMHSMNVVPRAPYSMAPTQPLGVPQVWSLAFWSGLWGLAFALLFPRARGARLIVAALIFGAILPTLVGWFVIAPLRGQPMANGFVLSRMWIGPLVNGIWGLGTGIILALLSSVFTRAGSRRRA